MLAEINCDILRVRVEYSAYVRNGRVVQATRDHVGHRVNQPARTAVEPIVAAERLSVDSVVDPVQDTATILLAVTIIYLTVYGVPVGHLDSG